MLAGASGILGTFGGGQGGSLPGFDNSSSAESRAGPVTVGGLTFAPADDGVLKVGLAVAAVALVALWIGKRGR